MRVSGDRCGAREPEPRAAGFDEALSRARGAVERGRGNGAAPRQGVPARGLVARGGRGRAGPGALAGAGAPAAEPGRTDRALDLPPVAELAAVARALPPAVAAARVADGPLALSFGRSLDVELRATPEGIELLLRPEASLARAAEAELPRVVAALRVRGVAVARAEVRPRPGDGGRAR